MSAVHILDSFYLAYIPELATSTKKATVTMPPSEAIESLEVIDNPSPSKRIVRYLFHLVHLSVSLLLFAAIILGLIEPFHLFLLYLIPLVVILLIVEISWICHKDPPEKFARNLGWFNAPLVRSYIYQLAGVFPIVIGAHSSMCVRTTSGVSSWHPSAYVEVILGSIIWCIGVALFFIVSLACRCGFADWVQDPQGRGIRLPEDDMSTANLV